MLTVWEGYHIFIEDLNKNKTILLVKDEDSI